MANNHQESLSSALMQENRSYATNANLTKHSLTSGAVTVISRIAGFIRDMLTANLFGATVGYDAFILAFRIPNLMRRL
ncbi:MAG: hypothetical protein ACR2HS_07060, partial [Gammaproteobacteria bacterium]